MSISESAAPVCEDQARLLKLCAVAECDPQCAIEQLTWIRHAVKKADYRELQEFAETASNIMKDAWQAVKHPQSPLERHTAGHGW